jgi:hypothetical protein
MNEFFGIEVRVEGRIVQRWFDALPLDAREYILNLVLHLERLPMGRWRRPDYDPLDGEGGISELRPKDVRGADGNIVYRIYGMRGHPSKNSYTFLHGTDKDAKNDVEGKEHAKWRLDQLLRKEAQAHKFDFASEFNTEIEEGQGS